MSRGIATVTFGSSDGAQKAFKALNGLLVDGKPIKIEIVVSAANAALLPTPKTLTERISQPKSQPKAQPKSAASKKETASKDASGAAGARGKGKGRKTRNARPAKKTAEELDSEMADYFESGTQNNENTNGGAAPAATNGDAPMDDEIMVCKPLLRRLLDK